MGRVAKLIMVTADNNNKFYDMVEEPDGGITATWGRVNVTSTVTHYPPGKWAWEALIRSKTKKGYKDVTALRSVNTVKSDFVSISDSDIQAIVQELQGYANVSVQQNYTISAEAVTPQMVDAAQAVMNALVPLIDVGTKAKDVNDKFLELYSIIPRRMKNVKLHIITDSKITKDNLDDARKLLANEQATLDVMRGQVSVSKAQKQTGPGNSTTILEAMGIKLFKPTAQDIAAIKKHLGPNAHQFTKAFGVINEKTQARFDRWLQNARNKHISPFWHGSRNENWWSIIEMGLVLRPTGAIISGKMFGYGLYFADRAQKSLGYTSLRGSYWANGSANKGFLSLYDVHLGNFLKIRNHEPWCGSLTKDNLKRRGDYDSLFAEGGADLRNNEYIVYDEVQCTIKFLVEVR